MSRRDDPKKTDHVRVAKKLAGIRLDSGHEPSKHSHGDAQSSQHSKKVVEVSAKPQKTTTSNPSDKKEQKAPSTSSSTSNGSIYQWNGEDKIPASNLTPLENAIKDGTFFTKGKAAEVRMLDIVRKAFKEESKMMKTIEPSESGQPNATEQQRTELSVKALFWIITNDYTSFVDGQKYVILSRESFAEIRGVFRGILGSPKENVEAYVALILSIFVNDLGKAIKPDGENHDKLLAGAARKGLVECIDRLSPAMAKEVKLGIELGGELNIAQAPQGENVPRCLNVLTSSIYKSAFDSRYLEQVLDIAGAQGHNRPGEGCTSMVEPNWKGLKTVLKQCRRLIADEIDPVEAYNEILKKRAQILRGNGFRPLDVKDVKDRALMRLFLMGRVLDEKNATQWEQTFKSLPDKVRGELTRRLNVNGSLKEHAIIPYFMPAVFVEGLSKHGDLGVMMEYLNMVLKTPPVTDKGHVYERDLSEARKYVRTPEFKNNPRSLLTAVSYTEKEVI